MTTITQNIIPNGKTQFLDTGGLPLNAGLVYTYDASGTTPKATYKDAAGASVNTNPIVLDANGMCQLWGTGIYTLVVEEANGTTLYTVNTQEPTTLLGITATGASLITATSVAAVVTLLGIVQPSIQIKATAYAVQPTDNGSTIKIGAFALTLPLTSGIATGFLVTVVSSAVGTTVNPNGATVNLPAGATTAAFSLPSAFDTITLQWDGTVWNVVAASPDFFSALSAASNSVTQTGTSTTAAVTPAGLAATMLGGVGQTWQVMTSSRNFTTTYTNSTGRPIEILLLALPASGTQPVASLTINGTSLGSIGGAYYGYSMIQVSFVVQNGETYAVPMSTAILSYVWLERR